VGRCWAERLHKPVGQLGRCEAFRPGEEGGCGGLSWAKRPGGLGATVGFTMKNQKKEKGNGRAAKATGPKLV
jgi:hypothetical protein